VRRPEEVVESFARTGGRLSEGLEYEVAFNREMNRELRETTDDVELRRVLLYEYVASRIARHLEDPHVFLVRYERWFTDREGLMRDIGRFLGVDLGPGLPVIREPRSHPHDPRVARLVRDHCPSAAALGYDARVPTPDSV
jgi:hypothetical protein